MAMEAPTVSPDFPAPAPEQLKGDATLMWHSSQGVVYTSNDGSGKQHKPMNKVTSGPTFNMKEELRAMREDIDTMKADHAKIKADHASLQAKTAQHDEQLAEVKADIATIKADHTSLKAAMAGHDLLHLSYKLFDCVYKLALDRVNDVFCDLIKTHLTDLSEEQRDGVGNMLPPEGVSWERWVLLLPGVLHALRVAPKSVPDDAKHWGVDVFNRLNTLLGKHYTEERHKNIVAFFRTVANAVIEDAIASFGTTTPPGTTTFTCVEFATLYWTIKGRGSRRTTAVRGTMGVADRSALRNALTNIDRGAGMFKDAGGETLEKLFSAMYPSMAPTTGATSPPPSLAGGAGGGAGAATSTGGAPTHTVTVTGTITGTINGADAPAAAPAMASAPAESAAADTDTGTGGGRGQADGSPHPRKRARHTST